MSFAPLYILHQECIHENVDFFKLSDWITSNFSEQKRTALMAGKLWITEECAEELEIQTGLSKEAWSKVCKNI